MYNYFIILAYSMKRYIIECDLACYDNDWSDKSHSFGHISVKSKINTNNASSC